MTQQTHAPTNLAPAVDPLAGLARLAQSGDVEARRKLLTALGPEVLRVIRMTMGRGHPDVEDVAQDSLIAVLKALDSFRSECTVVHFARRIAARRALDSRRRARTAARLAVAASFGTTDSVRASDPVASEVRRLLVELPEEQAEALAMRVILGCSVEEISAATGVVPNTVRSRLRLAKHALRARLAPREPLTELAEET